MTEKTLSMEDIQRIIIGEERYKVLNLFNSLLKENAALKKQVEVLTEKPVNGEDQL
mgnify:CR=1 FL=1